MVLSALLRVNEELGRTTLLITHNAVIAALGDRVLRFADGRVASESHNSRRARPEELSW